jgi:arylsulfatase A-like enzyme
MLLIKCNLMKMSRIKIGILLIGGILLFICCQTPPTPKEKIYRFIDNLEKENIVISPLADIAEGTEETVPPFPVKSYPVLDLGSGSNPYGIKRKLNIREAENNVIFSPPRSRYVFDIHIPENSVLECGTGIVKGPKPTTTVFTIEIDIGGHKEILLQKTHAFSREDQKRVFQPHKIDMSSFQGRARISFGTEGTDQNYSFWLNPVLYPKKKKGTNIILISIDTLRADHLGCYGYQRETSPAIDSLAEDSSLFFNTFSSSSWTLPAHVSLLTSLTCFHHQVNYEYDKMDSSMITLADVLRQKNFYCSAHTGGGFVNAAYGFSKGFDSYGQSAQGIHQKDASEWIGRSTLKWIDNHKDKDFFLFIHTYQPHNPFSSPPPYNTMFLEENSEWTEIDILKYLGGKEGVFKNIPDKEIKNIISLYDAEIRYTDDVLIKPLMNKLEETGLYNQTMIILTSDHGEEFYDHGGWEHGHTLYNELLKVPLIIKFPGEEFAGTQIQTIVRLIDIMPTVLEKLGISSKDLKLDGKSLIPVLKNKEKRDRIFLAYKADNILKSHIPQKISANEGTDKLILNKKFTDEQLIFFQSPPPDLPPVELYNLSEHSLEKNNIADSKVKTSNRLIRLINEALARATYRKTERVEIDESLLEQLKALGYLR